MKFGLIGIFLVGFFLSDAQLFTNYNTLNSQLPSDNVHVIYFDNNENTWIGTENGLVKIDVTNTWTIYNTTNSGLPENDIRSIFLDDENVLWLGTVLSGLVKYDAVVWTVYDPLNSPLPDFHVRTITKDLNDTIWIGTTGGLTKWDGNDFWFTYNTANSELRSSNIPDIYVNADNTKYIGTLNGGLSTYENGIINYYKTDNSGISDNTILAIDEDSENNIWLATSFGGISVLTPDTVFLEFTPISSDIVDWSVDDLAIDQNDIVAIAMAATGFHLFDGIDWTLFDSNNSELTDDFINCVAIHPNNDIWLGSTSQGIFIMDRPLSMETLDPSFNIYPNPASDQFILSGTIRGTTMSIYSIEGKFMSEEKLESNIEFINIQNLYPGNYILKLTTHQGITVKQFTVMR